MLLAFTINALLSICGAYICNSIIIEFIPIFIHRKMFGNDQCKISNSPIPEPMGVICAAVYLIIMFLFIPFTFVEWTQKHIPIEEFPYDNYLAYFSALTSICTAILLGFADDVLDLRWRHKLLFPTLSSLPILMAYYVSGHSTFVIMPKFLYGVFGLGSQLNIGLLYYIYMGMMVIFCTNAVNILAGINGLEAGQSLVIACSVVIFNFIQLYRVESQQWYHCLSLYFLLPYISTTTVLLRFNWYPARVFVGDTFCYWSGMTLAVVSILGHFSKTMLLFLLPQVFNFLYSIPQLFLFVPCPRHRLPRFDHASNCLEMSVVVCKITDIKPLGRLSLAIFDAFGLLYRREFVKDNERWIEFNNLTLINLCLKLFGSMHEQSLTQLLLIIQIFCSLIAFFIRFYLAALVYEVVC